MSRSISLFDFDGTLIRRDSTSTLVKQLLRLRPWRGVLVAPLVVRLRRARTPEALQDAKCAIIGSLLKGLSTSRAMVAARRAASLVRAQRRPEVVDALRACAERGQRVIVASASPAFFLRVALDDLPAEVVATEFALEGDRHTGRMAGSVCFGAAKVPAIQAMISPGVVIDDAWSDSLHDQPMMRLARRRFWLCPPADPLEVRRMDPDGTLIEAGMK